ncbi:helix-turn-helix domain-containing protein [Virgisporangium ochraceum]|uniref:helix-turn-helix domain-containing protein n=1 Tax=Virgisporangium ochraceum TaxID=65505 RepID=UPI001940EB9D|nr:helix-turn-helix domain-containing protein [Virgisporangium ochraceum]
MKPSEAPVSEPDPLLVVNQVAHWLGEPRATLYAWRTPGLDHRAIHVGNMLRYGRSEIERWLDGHTDCRC